MNEHKIRCGAVVLAAGSGKRMGTGTKKQFLLLKEKPILYYSLKAMQDSFMDEIVLVTGKEDIAFCKEEIVDRYGFDKVKTITEGGRERYHSVALGLEKLGPCDYIFIHDGARPFLTQDILESSLRDAKECGACVTGVPVKDTIKITDENGFVKETPSRRSLYAVQTPQTFSAALIREGYRRLLEQEDDLLSAGIAITDDAMVVETLMNHPVKISKGSYENIKITTPDDLKTAEGFLNV